MGRLPREARDGIMRAWLEILRERHPGVSWMQVEQTKEEAAPHRRAHDTDDARMTVEAETTMAA
jgi:hypothetical protein